MSDASFLALGSDGGSKVALTATVGREQRGTGRTLDLELPTAEVREHLAGGAEEKERWPCRLAAAATCSTELAQGKGEGRSLEGRLTASENRGLGTEEEGGKGKALHSTTRLG